MACVSPSFVRSTFRVFPKSMFSPTTVSDQSVIAPSRSSLSMQQSRVLCVCQTHTQQKRWRWPHKFGSNFVVAQHRNTKGGLKRYCGSNSDSSIFQTLCAGNWSTLTFLKRTWSYIFSMEMLVLSWAVLCGRQFWIWPRWFFLLLDRVQSIWHAPCAWSK